MKLHRGNRRRVLLYAAAIAVVAAVSGIALFVPYVTFHPICTPEYRRFPKKALSGRISQQFLAALDAETQFGRPWFRAGETRLVRLVDWLDREWYLNVTGKATYRLVEARTGVGMGDLWSGRAKIPGFDKRGGPTCSAVRELAIVGGRWEHEGPPVRYVDDTQ